QREERAQRRRGDGRSSRRPPRPRAEETQEPLRRLAFSQQESGEREQWNRGNPRRGRQLLVGQELTTSTGIAAIPLFTLAGFLLAEGKSSERLLRLFRAWAGWAPGGTAIAAAALCAFFTLFTGGSGVTILVLGGLLLPALLGDRYRERFSIGLLTASGSLGLLFPLSLPLMLYGIVSQKTSIEDLFIGGLLPGILMLGLLATLGVREGTLSRAERPPFRLSEA